MSISSKIGGLAKRPAFLRRASSSVPSPHPSRRSPIHPDDVKFSKVWLGLGAAASALGLAGVYRYGWPAATLGGGIGSIGLAYMTLFEPTRPVLERVELRFPDLPPALEGARIGQISDSHLGLRFAARNLAWAVEQMRRERPELIVFTGDFVHTPEAIAELPCLLRGLGAPLGMYAVPGNHDYWEGMAELNAALAPLGIPMLLNEHRRLSWNGAELWLAGTDDVWDGRPDLDAALRGVPRDGFTVLLAHTPHLAMRAAERGVDLQLSGHTHGGHLRLPILGPFARPRYSTDYMIGRYNIGRMVLYVSRGIGGAPLRLFCRPEATIITLRRG